MRKEKQKYSLFQTSSSSRGELGMGFFFQFGSATFMFVSAIVFVQKVYQIHRDFSVFFIFPKQFMPFTFRCEAHRNPKFKMVIECALITIVLSIYNSVFFL